MYRIHIIYSSYSSSFIILFVLYGCLYLSLNFHLAMILGAGGGGEEDLLKSRTERVEKNKNKCYSTFNRG